jgi:hypothetical protein
MHAKTRKDCKLENLAFQFSVKECNTRFKQRPTVYFRMAVVQEPRPPANDKIPTIITFAWTPFVCKEKCQHRVRYSKNGNSTRSLINIAVFH